MVIFIYFKMKFNWRDFSVDIPRIQLFVDGVKVCSQKPLVIFGKIVDIFGDYDTESICYYMCQQCLAQHYINETKKIKDSHEQLVSRGRHEVHICSKKRTVVVIKEFLKLYIFEGDAFVLDTCTLSLFFDANTNKESGIWSYELLNSFLVSSSAV